MTSILRIKAIMDAEKKAKKAGKKGALSSTGVARTANAIKSAVSKKKPSTKKVAKPTKKKTAKKKK